MLKDAGCSEDDIKLVKCLLTNTKLKIKLEKATSEAFFETTLGSFQGDCLSGKLFTLYLAGSLNHLRAVLLNRPNPPISNDQMPLEMVYVDDTDFLDENKENLETMLPKITSLFMDWNLKVNPTKTEFTEVSIDENPKNRGKEAWRDHKILGSKACSIKDIENRIRIANHSFKNLQKCWLKGTKLRTQTKLRVYNTMIVPILLYNSGTWAVPKNVLEKIESCRRTHLRIILNIRYPNIISNEELYKRCEMTPLIEDIEKARWNTFGKILRQSENKPAQNALIFAVVNSKKFPPRRGRPPINLLDSIKEDIKRKGLKIDKIEDIWDLRRKAKDKKLWESL